jgi:hypothetical protein
VGCGRYSRCGSSGSLELADWGKLGELESGGVCRGGGGYLAENDVYVTGQGECNSLNVIFVAESEPGLHLNYLRTQAEVFVQVAVTFSPGVTGSVPNCCGSPKQAGPFRELQFRRRAVYDDVSSFASTSTTRTKNNRHECLANRKLCLSDKRSCLESKC